MDDQGIILLLLCITLFIIIIGVGVGIYMNVKPTEEPAEELVDEPTEDTTTIVGGGAGIHFSQQVTNQKIIEYLPNDIEINKRYTQYTDTYFEQNNKIQYDDDLIEQYRPENYELVLYYRTIDCDNSGYWSAQVLILYQLERYQKLVSILYNYSTTYSNDNSDYKQCPDLYPYLEFKSQDYNYSFIHWYATLNLDKQPNMNVAQASTNNYIIDGPFTDMYREHDFQTDFYTKAEDTFMTDEQIVQYLKPEGYELILYHRYTNFSISLSNDKAFIQILFQKGNYQILIDTTYYLNINCYYDNRKYNSSLNNILADYTDKIDIDGVYWYLQLK